MLIISSGLRYKLADLEISATPTGLYAGLALNLVRVVPSCVATFLTYEYLMGVLANSDKMQ